MGISVSGVGSLFMWGALLRGIFRIKTRALGVGGLFSKSWDASKTWLCPQWRRSSVCIVEWGVWEHETTWTGSWSDQWDSMHSTRVIPSLVWLFGEQQDIHSPAQSSDPTQTDSLLPVGWGAIKEEATAGPRHPRRPRQQERKSALDTKALYRCPSLEPSTIALFWTPARRCGNSWWLLCRVYEHGSDSLFVFSLSQATRYTSNSIARLPSRSSRSVASRNLSHTQQPW